MLLSPRKDGLDSLFKEVRVLKVALAAWKYSFDSTLRKLSVHPKYG